FQSTPPRGGRHHHREPGVGGVAVSIHAPARGATRGEGRHLDSPKVSIHAPARGATVLLLVVARPTPGFNPRPRAGGDGARADVASRTISFQSTPPRGGRRASCGYRLQQSLVSIHAPARGATLLLL